MLFSGATRLGPLSGPLSLPPPSSPPKNLRPSSFPADMPGLGVKITCCEPRCAVTHFLTFKFSELKYTVFYQNYPLRDYALG